MPVARSYQHHRSNGFSLIEVLVVMVILSLAAGFVVFNLPDTRPSARGEALKLAARLHLLADSAIERGTLAGISVGEKGYYFVLQRFGGWGPHPDLGGGSLQPWPIDMAITLIIEGEEANLNEKTLIEDRTPLIFFTPTGESRPFQMVFDELYSNSRDPTYRITSDMISNINVLAGPAERETGRRQGRRR